MKSQRRVNFIWGNDGKIKLVDNPDGRWVVIDPEYTTPKTFESIRIDNSVEYKSGIDPYDFKS